MVLIAKKSSLGHQNPGGFWAFQNRNASFEPLDKRPLLPETLYAMPTYLLKREVLTLLEAETHPMYRLILDVMWCTGARVSEVLAITPTSFHDDGYDFGVILKTLRQAGRATEQTQPATHS